MKASSLLNVKKKFWLNQRNIVVIPKSTHRERMAENFIIFDFTLIPEEKVKIATLDTNIIELYVNKIDKMPILSTKLCIYLHKTAIKIDEMSFEAFNS